MCIYHLVLSHQGILLFFLLILYHDVNFVHEISFMSRFPTDFHHSISLGVCVLCMLVIPMEKGALHIWKTFQPQGKSNLTGRMMPVCVCVCVLKGPPFVSCFCPLLFVVFCCLLSFVVCCVTSPLPLLSPPSSSFQKNRARNEAMKTRRIDN